MTFQEEVLAAALEYAARGWRVFPLHTVDAAGACSCGVEGCADAGKHPRVPRGLKAASAEREQVAAWFGADAPPCNVAIATGEASGITVLDVDIGPNKHGAESWAEAISGHGEPHTLMARTGGGGMHVLFAYNSALKTASNVLGRDVDCRNDGGYIVAPPSRHRSGVRYAWLNAGTELAVLPAHLARRRETRGRPKHDDTYRSKYTLEQIRAMLEHVPADDRDLWRTVGVALGREFHRTDAAWEVYAHWADKYTGTRGRNHDAIMREAFYELSQQEPLGAKVTIGSIVKAAIDNGWAPRTGDVPIENFVYYGPGNNYIYRPTCSSWIAAAVDAAVSPRNEHGRMLRASEWLKLNQLCTSMTCEPAIAADYVKGYDCRHGEIVAVPGAALFNTYRAPTIELGDAALATPFLQHIRRVFNKPGDAAQFLSYMAHRVQRPWEKPRFALLIAGGQGVGKDTAVEFCCPAIGVWNVSNIDPAAFDSAFNEFAATTLVRISEAANLHEMSKWAFNERTKVLIAGAPDVCVINPKYGQKYSVRMYCGVILTTNNLASGIYIPPDDRRYDVIETATLQAMGLQAEDARRTYFSELWEWFNTENGAAHVAAFLHQHSLAGWSASNGQRRTAAHGMVVVSGMAKDEWLDDILEELGTPDAVRADWVIARAVAMGEKDFDVKRKLSATMGRLGYVLHKNPLVKDGRWKIGDKKHTVYLRADVEAFDPTATLDKEPF